ncbi:hypothetical protein CDAR_167641 [Caerostris darwini]|uniref:Uncharacterized protein n=1 Tax=Caerostris darwini TaxID=1538125 RepID=A0AAV4M6S6_9ARAC|nr:hypothetical protein CDAR_167641 [Caerostris darwini]
MPELVREIPIVLKLGDKSPFQSGSTSDLNASVTDNPGRLDQCAEGSSEFLLHTEPCYKSFNQNSETVEKDSKNLSCCIGFTHFFPSQENEHNNRLPEPIDTTPFPSTPLQTQTPSVPHPERNTPLIISPITTLTPLKKKSIGENEVIRFFPRFVCLLLFGSVLITLKIRLPVAWKIFRFSSALSPVTAVLKPGAYWPPETHILNNRVHTHNSGMKQPWSSKKDNPNKCLD